MSVRVGSQWKYPSCGCFKWSGQQKEVTCEWKQSFCLVVRQEPIEEDLGDVLALRVMSYQMARKDICLGKADISVATLGNPMRPPQTGVILLRGERWFRRSSCGLNRGNLSQRMAQDFWVPLTVTNPISMQTIHAGEVRLRLLIQPVPPFHQYYEQFPHPRILYSDDDAHQQRAPRGTSGTGHEHFAVATLPVEAREETEEDRTMHEGLLRRFLRSVRHSAHGASPEAPVSCSRSIALIPPPQTPSPLRLLARLPVLMDRSTREGNQAAYCVATRTAARETLASKPGVRPRKNWSCA